MPVTDDADTRLIELNAKVDHIVAEIDSVKELVSGIQPIMDMLRVELETKGLPGIVAAIAKGLYQR